MLRTLLLTSAIVLSACATGTNTTPDTSPEPKPEPISTLCPEAEDVHACSKHIAANQWIKGFAEREVVLETFADLCDGGVGAACFWASQRLESSDERLALLAKGCALGSAFACSSEGQSSMGRWFVPHDPFDPPAELTSDQAEAAKRSFELLTRACDPSEADFADFVAGWGDEANATLHQGRMCSGLASMYEHGFHVPKDHARALELNTKSCDELGSRQGCEQLGFFYSVGVGAPIDEAKSRAYRRKACLKNPMKKPEECPKAEE